MDIEGRGMDADDISKIVFLGPHEAKKNRNSTRWPASGDDDKHPLCQEYSRRIEHAYQ